MKIKFHSNENILHNIIACNLNWIWIQSLKFNSNISNRIQKISTKIQLNSIQIIKGKKVSHGIDLIALCNGFASLINIRLGNIGHEFMAYYLEP